MCHHHHPGVFLHYEQGLSGHRGPLDLQSNEAAPDQRAGGLEATQQAGDEGRRRIAGNDSNISNFNIVLK